MFGTGSTDDLQMFGKICVRFDLVRVEVRVDFSKVRSADLPEDEPSRSRFRFHTADNEPSKVAYVRPILYFGALPAGN